MIDGEPHPGDGYPGLSREELVERLWAAEITAEEGGEIIGEQACALAGLAGELLKPCQSPCEGHFGPKTQALFDAGLARYGPATEERGGDTYRNLLTSEEAWSCREYGYRGPWVIYPKDGGIPLLVIDEETLGTSLAGGLYLFAPAPGHYLPMEVAPRDGRMLLLSVSPVQSFCREGVCTGFWREGTGFWQVDSGRHFDKQFTGWAPIVIQETP